MTAREFWKRFLFVSHCVGCRSILDPEERDEAFCPSCMLKWEEAKTRNCPSCFSEVVRCRCMPKLLAKSGALCLCKLFFYRADRATSAPNRLLYRLKHHKNERMERFVARELSVLVKEEMKLLEIDAKDALIAFVPRSRQAVRVEGFDQSERMARALSQLLGIEAKCVLARSGRSHEQKKLGGAARMKNAAGKFVCTDPVAIKGKYVFLYDDVVTTGASMAACVKELRAAGVRGVIGLALAQDEDKKR